MTQRQSAVERALILSGGGARGAYQVGVWQRLQEIGWQPDLVCGTSIGSINGSLIGMGWDAARMAQFWESLERKHAFRLSLWRRIKYRFGTLVGINRGWPALLDNRPLRDLLTKMIDEQSLRDASPKVVVTATNVCRAELRYFSGDELSVEHILASCSIPVFFPWRRLNGELYWDGGIMANTPILPALQQGAREIVVVLMAPLTGELVPAPKNTRQAIAWTLDLITIASAKTLWANLAYHLGMDLRQSADSLAREHFIDAGGVQVSIVAPRGTTGLESILDLNPQAAKERIAAGYRDACEQLTHVPKMTDNVTSAQSISPGCSVP